jgi:hypothetical protein
MTQYGEDRELRRKQSATFGAFCALGLVVEVSAKMGIVVALLGVSALLVVLYGLLSLAFWRSWRAELRRRAGGAPPSWSAQLPLMVAEQFGIKSAGRHSARLSRGQLFGRLVYLGDGLRGEPREADRDRGVGPVTWDWSWTVEIIPIWGYGNQGCLTLTRADGFAVDVWILRPADLSQTLGLGP